MDELPTALWPRTRRCNSSKTTCSLRWSSHGERARCFQRRAQTVLTRLNHGETQLSGEDTGPLQAGDMIPDAEPHGEPVIGPGCLRPDQCSKSDSVRTMALGENPTEVREAARSTMQEGYHLFALGRNRERILYFLGSCYVGPGLRVLLGTTVHASFASKKKDLSKSGTQAEQKRCRRRETASEPCRVTEQTPDGEWRPPRRSFLYVSHNREETNTVFCGNNGCPLPMDAPVWSGVGPGRFSSAKSSPAWCADALCGEL